MLFVWLIYLKCKCELFWLWLRFSGSQHIPWLSSFPVQREQRLVAGEHTDHFAYARVWRQRTMLRFPQPRLVWEGSYSFQWSETKSDQLTSFEITHDEDRRSSHRFQHNQAWGPRDGWCQHRLEVPDQPHLLMLH